ncbi:MAG: hypothetical protein HY204_02945 [Nitrospirae bacterium]|nr:hypothetical protein [Nitrospirota bacterium]
MTREIERIEYRRGMIDPGAKLEDLPVRTWSSAEIPDEIREAIHREGILDLGGVYGDREAGDPIEYDHLRLVLPDGMVEIEFFNRGIALIMTDDERFRRIHRVLCKLDGDIAILNSVVVKPDRIYF